MAETEPKPTCPQTDAPEPIFAKLHVGNDFLCACGEAVKDAPATDEPADPIAHASCARVSADSAAVARIYAYKHAAKSSTATTSAVPTRGARGCAAAAAPTARDANTSITHASCSRVGAS